MKGPPDRRKRSLGALLFSDPYRKLVALALAWDLWFYLDNQVSDSFRLTLDLQAYNQAASFNEPGERKLAVPIPMGMFTVNNYLDVDTGSEVTRITVTFRGPKALIKELKSSHNFGVRTREPLMSASSFEFGIEDLVGRQQFLDLIDEIQPSRIRVGLERVTEVALTPNLEMIGLRYANQATEDAFFERVHPDRAILSPPTIVVIGPESKIARAGSLTFETLPIKLTEGAIKTELVLISDDPDLRMSQAVRITIPVDPERTPYLMEIPVVVADGMMPPEQQGKWVADETAITTMVEAYGVIQQRYLTTPQARADFPRQHFVLMVSLDEADKDAEEVTRAAQLVAHGLDEIDRSEYRLAGTVTITVRRKSD